MGLLDPKSDDVFKRLFADSPDLVAALISAVRCDEPPVEVLQVLNPQILPEDLTGKAIELDVLARDSRGRLFNVEVQVLVPALTPALTLTRRPKRPPVPQPIRSCRPSAATRRIATAPSLGSARCSTS